MVLEIYEASHGGVTSIPAELASFESVEQLVQIIASATGVPAEHVLLFLEDGRDLKDEVLHELWERGGQGSQSDAGVQHLYLFNRQTFYAETPDHWAAQFQEDLVLPPPLNPISDLSQAQIPFLFAHDHLQHLFALLQAQCSALSIAYDSLGTYLDPLLSEWESLQGKAKGELEKQYELLRNSPGDMALLGKITVLDVLAKRRDKDKDKDKEGHRAGAGETEGSSYAAGAGAAAAGAGRRDREKEEERTMASYVNAGKMEQVRETCRVTHESQIKMYDDLTDLVYDLAEQSNAQRAAALGAIDGHVQEFQGGIERMEVAVRRLEELFEQGGGHVLTEDLMELDMAMREDLAVFTDVKNEFTLELHHHIKQVASFQIRIADLTVPLGSLESELAGKGAFPHLERLHQLPFAYAATVLEVVRRKELAAHLHDLTAKINDEVAAYLEKEKTRRTRLRAEALSHLPWNVAALEEDKLEWKVSVRAGNELLSGMQVGQEDIQHLLDTLDHLVDDPDLASQDTNPIPGLIDRVQQLLQQSATMGTDFQQALHRGISSDAEVGTAANANTQLEAANRIAELEEQLAVRDNQQAEFERILAETSDDHSRIMREAEAAAEAQWSAEAELREKTTEYERERDEARDVISGLQADVEQDKSRINDLGVRLQEALLDVDGLKNAEQALVGQIQDLQEERTKHLAALSEAQSSTLTAQSEMAGLRAELEATAAQLVEIRNERDHALKSQSAEAERLMRDRIAEADGDRAVLEHQNLTLTKELEDAKAALEQKLSTERNTAARTENGLKAELSFTKAQLREAQRKGSVLADELAMAKDKQATASLKDAYSSDVAKDAVALAGVYHEACARLLTAIMASSTIASSSAGSTLLAQSKLLTSADAKKADKGITTVVDNADGASTTNLRESILLRSLAAAQSFDLDHFSASVTHTISLVRKLGKTCRHYRDQMRSKISFTSFAKGDLALFLPTRNANTRPWMAYNVAAPHHFLKLPEDEKRRDMWKGRDSIVARITATEESVAGDTPDANPFGLAEGLRFYIHSVEEYVPSAPIRAPRRSASHSVAATSVAGDDAASVKSPSRPSRPSMGRPAQSESALATMAHATSPSVEKGEPFPALSEEESGTGSGSGEADDDVVPPIATARTAGQSSITSEQAAAASSVSTVKPDSPTRRVSSFSRTKSISSLPSSSGFEKARTPLARPAPLADTTSTLKPPPDTSPHEGAKLSPVLESFHLSNPPPSAMLTTPLAKPSVLPPFAIRPGTKSSLPATLPLTAASPRPGPAGPRALTSPQPSVRPSSRSSAHTTSSLMTGLLVSSKGTPAPAMAVTSSGDGTTSMTPATQSSVPSPRVSAEYRRASLEARRTTSGGSAGRPAPSSALRLGLGMGMGMGRAGDPAGTRYLPSPFDAGSPESETGLSQAHAHAHAGSAGPERKASVEHTSKALPPPPVDEQVDAGRSRVGSVQLPGGPAAAIAKEEGLGTSRFWTMTRKRLPSFGFGVQGPGQGQAQLQAGSPTSPTPLSPASTGGQGAPGRSSAQDMLRRFDS